MCEFEIILFGVGSVDVCSSYYTNLCETRKFCVDFCFCVDDVFYVFRMNKFLYWFIVEFRRFSHVSLGLLLLYFIWTVLKTY